MIKRTDKGITFIEILVATLVFTLALASVLGSMVSIADLIDLARDTTIATTDLKNMMERMRATPFALIIPNFPNGMTDGPGPNRYPPLVGGYQLTSEHITVTYANPNAQPLEIKITLTWLDKKGHSRNASMSTFKTR